MTYTLCTDGDKTVLSVTLEAMCDRATPVNLTQHSYFNLAGHASGDVLDHELTLLGCALGAPSPLYCPTPDCFACYGIRVTCTTQHLHSAPTRIAEEKSQSACGRRCPGLKMGTGRE